MLCRRCWELCDFWITFNEPNVYATEGYVLGSYPPGEQQIVRAFQVMRNMLQAHVQSFYVMRRLQPEGQIGYCLHYRLFDAANDLSPFDRGAAGLQETFFNWAILQAAETGRFSFPLKYTTHADKARCGDERLSRSKLLHPRYGQVRCDATC